MSRQIAVVIGVSTVPGLHPLPGTRSGVKQFCNWADSQGFVQDVHDDFDGTPVRAEKIYASISNAIQAGDLERLFLYFAGHGFVNGGDLWLLSEADQNPNAAINVALSVRLAKRCGIPHVAFFADACRSPVGKENLDVAGQSIFPIFKTDTVPQIDEFYATRYGDPAMEKAPAGVAENAFGIFSRCLMIGLSGLDERAVRDVTSGPAARAVMSTALRDYLIDEVRLVASREVNVVQTPDIVPTSAWQPNVLAWLSVETPTALTMPPPPPPGGEAALAWGAPDAADSDDITISRSSGAADDAELDYETSAKALPVVAQRLSTAWGIEPGRLRPRPAAPGSTTKALDALEYDVMLALSDQYTNASDRGRFETHAGASVNGADVDAVESSDGSSDIFWDIASWHFRGLGIPATTMLRTIPQTGGPASWAAIGTLPGYIGTLSIGADGVSAVQYRPHGHEGNEALARGLGAAVAADRVGRFDPDDLDGTQRELLYENLNPTLVLLAAHHFERWGQGERVRELMERMLDRLTWTLFDLALLADVPPEQLPVVPSFPMLSRGWALLDAIELPPQRRDLFRTTRRYLRQAQWTTFTDMNLGLVRALVSSR